MYPILCRCPPSGLERFFIEVPILVRSSHSGLILHGISLPLSLSNVRRLSPKDLSHLLGDFACRQLRSCLLFIVSPSRILLPPFRTLLSRWFHNLPMISLLVLSTKSLFSC